MNANGLKNYQQWLLFLKNKEHADSTEVDTEPAAENKHIAFSQDDGLSEQLRDRQGVPMDINATYAENDFKNYDSRMDGGPGSGNWGHMGRVGEVGGSLSGGGAGYRLTNPNGGFSSLSGAYKENAKRDKDAAKKAGTEGNAGHTERPNAVGGSGSGLSKASNDNPETEKVEAGGEGGGDSKAGASKLTEKQSQQVDDIKKSIPSMTNSGDFYNAGRVMNDLRSQTGSGIKVKDNGKDTYIKSPQDNINDLVSTTAKIRPMGTKGTGVEKQLQGSDAAKQAAMKLLDMFPSAWSAHLVQTGKSFQIEIGDHAGVNVGGTKITINPNGTVWGNLGAIGYGLVRANNNLSKMAFGSGRMGDAHGVMNGIAGTFADPQYYSNSHAVDTFSAMMIGG